MLLNFKKWLDESNMTGNYVCINAINDYDGFFNEVGIPDPKTGSSPPKGDYHCTLMYSEMTNEHPDRIMDALMIDFNKTITADIVGFDCFDAEDKSKSCIVIKLKNESLDHLHDLMKGYGLKHSYSDFQPHITLKYNMDVEEAHYYKDLLNTSLETGNVPIPLIDLYGFKSDRINKNYA